jgi:hypothetical protein
VFLDDPAYFDKDLARYRRAAPETLRESAARWLTAGRVTLSVVPRGRTDLAMPESQPVSVS